MRSGTHELAAMVYFFRAARAHVTAPVTRARARVHSANARSPPHIVACVLYGFVPMCKAILWSSVLVSACAVDLAETREGTHVQTVVSLTFDDTRANQYQVRPLLAARDMAATFYVNSSRIGRSGYMTLEQLRGLEQDGNDIGGHTLGHGRLSTLTTDAARREICDDRAALLNSGLQAASFAYPFGDDTAEVRRLVAECGYNSGRDIGGLRSGSSCTGCPVGNTIPPQDRYRIRTNASVRSTDTLATLQQYVTQAENQGGGWVPLVFHHVCNGCNTYAISVETLMQFLDWLAAREETTGTVVRTVHEVICGSVQPAPGTMPPPESTNLIENASLETDANGDQTPDCWQRGGSGTNSATYTRSSAAFDGAAAQQITITSYTSGARRLVTRQDTGACAPSVTAGRSYRITARYFATTQPLFTVYYRNTSGSWLWWAQSPRFPTSSSYVQAAWTTPVVPADATAISVGLSITSTGSITMDAFTLTAN